MPQIYDARSIATARRSNEHRASDVPQHYVFQDDLSEVWQTDMER